MIEYVLGMKREFGVNVDNDDALRNALDYVRARCNCSKREFKHFVSWYFDCYALVAPKKPYDLEYAWVDYVEAGECLPIVTKADRMEMMRDG